MIVEMTEAEMQTMIAIQDEYVATVLSCTTGHIRRVRRGARKTAVSKLERLGFTTEQCHRIVDDAYDMATLELRAMEV